MKQNHISKEEMCNILQKKCEVYESQIEHLETMIKQRDEKIENSRKDSVAHSTEFDCQSVIT